LLSPLQRELTRCNHPNTLFSSWIVQLAPQSKSRFLSAIYEAAWSCRGQTRSSPLNDRASDAREQRIGTPLAQHFPLLAHNRAVCKHSSKQEENRCFFILLVFSQDNEKP
jgi:hypothetical protein